VELKNGSAFNGHLIACDNFMNLTLREVYETSAVSLAVLVRSVCTPGPDPDPDPDGLKNTEW
jgi:small nuclear ribonucleoprotein (snRNP)-like protein